jgi:class 3 adenylate cyclase
MCPWFPRLRYAGEARAQAFARVRRATGRRDAPPDEIVKGVIVIPDISGYTGLVSTVELVHAQEIITRLIEAIVREGWQMLHVSKLLGDAVLMYRPEDRMPPATLQRHVLDRVVAIYRAFAAERIAAHEERCGCPCAACQNIAGLELKFIVHYGEFLVHSVARFRELLGKDVITCFRLLKNGVSRKRYVLMTDAFLALDRSIEGRALEIGEETYPHLGAIRIGVLDPAGPPS